MNSGTKKERVSKSSRKAVPLLLYQPALADRFGVGRVFLVALDVSLHLFRRHQTNLVTELRQLTRPIMRRSTRLNANEAGGGSAAKNFNT